MNQKTNRICKKSMLRLSVVRNLFFFLPLNLVMMACDNHETQYTYYDDSKSIIKEKYEIDKASGMKDGFFQRYDQKGNVIYSVKYVNGELQKDYFTDERDGKRYRVTTIGNQTWMAENLNFKSNDSYCYSDDSTNCEKYGRLYKWNAAVHACPDGWDLPGDDDFRMLIETVGIESLKSKSGWISRNPKRKNAAYNGTDDYGFTLLPTGFKGRLYYEREGKNDYEGNGQNAYLWKKWENKESDEFYSAEITFAGYRVRGFHFFNRSIKDVKKHFDGEARAIRCLKTNDEKKSIEKITDSRDGNTYRIVTIEKQIWMAENLRYKSEGSLCQNDNSHHCEKYGRLYSWNAAMEACPTGWHLPSESEFETLFLNVGGFRREEELKNVIGIGDESLFTLIYWDDVGYALKSTSGWTPYGNIDSSGTDVVGFTALPAGMSNLYTESTNLEGVGEKAFFWSSSKKGKDDVPFHMELSLQGLGDINKHGGLADLYSVRCIKDE